MKLHQRPATPSQTADNLVYRARLERTNSGAVSAETLGEIARVLPGLAAADSDFVAQSLAQLGSPIDAQTRLGAEPRVIDMDAVHAKASNRNFWMGNGRDARQHLEEMLALIAEDGRFTAARFVYELPDELVGLRNAAEQLLAVSLTPADDLAHIVRVVQGLKDEAPRWSEGLKANLERLARARQAALRQPPGASPERENVAAMFAWMISGGTSPLPHVDPFFAGGKLQGSYTGEVAMLAMRVGALIATSSQPAADVRWVRSVVEQLKFDDPKALDAWLAGLDSAVAAREAMLDLPPGDLPERRELAHALSRVIADGRLEINERHNDMYEVDPPARALIRASPWPQAELTWLRGVLTQLKSSQPDQPAGLLRALGYEVKDRLEQLARQA